MLSAFVATFAYSAAGLYTVGVSGGNRTAAFPRLAVSGAIVEPIPSVAAIADTVMVAARTAPVRQPPGRRGAKPRPFGPYPVRDHNRAP